MEEVAQALPSIPSLATSFNTHALATAVACLFVICVFLLVMLFRAHNAHLKSLEAQAPLTAQLINLTVELKYLLNDHLRRNTGEYPAVNPEE